MRRREAHGARRAGSADADHRGGGGEDEAAGAGLREEPAEEGKVFVGRLELNLEIEFVVGLIKVLIYTCLR